MPLLYDAVGFGMWAYSRSAFRVRTLGRRSPRFRAGHLDRLHAPSRDGRAARLPFDLLRAGWAYGRPLAAHELCCTGGPVLAGILRGVSIRAPALAPASSLPGRNRPLLAGSDALSDSECDGGSARGGLPPAARARARGRVAARRPRSPAKSCARSGSAGAATRERGRARRVRRPPVAVAHSRPARRPGSRAGLVAAGLGRRRGTSASSLTSSRGGQSS